MSAVWGFLLGNGLDAQATVEAVKVEDIAAVHALDQGAPLTVSATTRAAGAVDQAISEAAGVVTVERQP